MKNLIFLLMTIPVFGAPPSETTIALSPTMRELIAPSYVTIAGIGISSSTGEVTIPKDKKLSEASREFWTELAKSFPEVKQAMIGDAATITKERDALRNLLAETQQRVTVNVAQRDNMTKQLFEFEFLLSQARGELGKALIQVNELQKKYDMEKEKVEGLLKNPGSVGVKVEEKKK